MVNSSGATDIPVTAFLTVTVHDAVYPPSAVVAVIVVEPTDCPTIVQLVPDALTAATAGLLETQVTL